MNILAITQHEHLVDRLKTAFEGNGHAVFHVKDPLDALASEAWNRSQLILVDAEGDPMDGFRFCTLLRGESRVLFQNLPIFMIFKKAHEAEMLSGLANVDVDGYLLAHDSLPRIIQVLSPALDLDHLRPDSPKVPVRALGLESALVHELAEFLDHFGFSLQACPWDLQAQSGENRPAPILLVGLEDADKIPDMLQRMWMEPQLPYVIILAKETEPATQRKLLVSGVMDWINLPLSHPHLLHACRRGLEWQQTRRIQQEFHHQLKDLKDRRTLLEMEMTALRSEVLTDPLTGLLNRRAFDQNLENAYNQWDRHHRPFLLILGDLDYFKLINDRFGHLAGDEVLKVISERIRAGLRRSDLAFRVGGEEFAVILTETSLEVGTEVAEKLRKRIEECPFALPEGQMVFPTMSFGVGGPERHGRDQLYAAVDEALYRAKRKGRNRTERAEAPANVRIR